MTLADLLNTLESADMLRIIKGGEEMFVGYLALFAPEVGHTNCKLYEQYISTHSLTKRLTFCRRGNRMDL